MKTSAQIVTSKINKLKGLHERLEQSIATAEEARAVIQVFGRDGSEYQKRYSEIETFITEKRFQIPRIQRTELNALQPTQGIQDKISQILQRANNVLDQLRDQKNQAMQQERAVEISSTAKMLQQLDIAPISTSSLENEITPPIILTLCESKEDHSAALESKSPPKLATDDGDWVDSEDENEYSTMLGTRYK